MNAADLGTVMVCHDTHKSASFDASTSDAGVDYSPPKVLHLKGIGDRLGYRPTKTTVEHEHAEQAGSAPKPEKKKKKKVGREYDRVLNSINWGRGEDLNSLHSILGKCIRRKGGLILITGERGSGKSFMLNKAWEIANDQGDTYLKMVQFSSKGKGTVYDIMQYATYSMFKQKFEEIGDSYEPMYATSVYPAWRGVVAEMAAFGAKKGGVSIEAWIEAGLVAFDESATGNIDGGLEPHIQLMLDFLDQSDSDVASRDVLINHNAPLALVGELLCALLWRFGMEYGPTMIKIHLQKHSSCISAFSEMESWTLLKDITDRLCNITVVVGTVLGLFEQMRCPINDGFVSIPCLP
jgi:hypothetical protein